MHRKKVSEHLNGLDLECQGFLLRLCVSAQWTDGRQGQIRAVGKQALYDLVREIIGIEASNKSIRRMLVRLADAGLVEITDKRSWSTLRVIPYLELTKNFVPLTAQASATNGTSKCHQRHKQDPLTAQTSADDGTTSTKNPRKNDSKPVSKTLKNSKNSSRRENPTTGDDVESFSEVKTKPTKQELEQFRFRLAEDQIAEHGSTKATVITLQEFTRHCDKQGWSEDWQEHFTNWVAKEKRLAVTSPNAKSATSSSLTWTSEETPVTVCVQWPPLDEFVKESERYSAECQGIIPMVRDKIDLFKRQKREPIVDVPGFVRKVAQLEFNYDQESDDARR